MYQTNITRSEAQDRSTRIKASSYNVVVDLTDCAGDGVALPDPATTFYSSSTVHFASAGGTDTINIIANSIVKAELDGVELDVSTFQDYKIPFTVEPGDHVLTVAAICEYSRTGEGLHRFVDPIDDRIYLYTQFESADARRMFANFDQPDQKATFQFTVDAPQHWTICSNSPTPTPTLIRDGIGRWEFEPTKKMSSYITALVAGEYDRVDDQYQGKHGIVPLGLLCRKSLRSYLDVERLYEVTRRGFEVFEEIFDYPYPFGKYDQCFVPEFNAGAMENAGCVTHRDDYIFRSRETAVAYDNRDNTILHELSHMWFGDLVTMKWWDDLWLNESFAEWSAYYCQAEIAKRWDYPVDAWASFCNLRKDWAYTLDQMPTTHPVAADMVDLRAVELNFDGITYSKGAATLRQLVAFVGDEVFLAGLRSYFKKYAFANTELTDLLTELESSSGRDLSWFTSQWLEKAGVNTLTPVFEVADDGTFSRFMIKQQAPADWPTLRKHRLAIGLYDVVDDVLQCVQVIETEIEHELTEVAQLIGVAKPAMILLNEGDLTYTKIRLDQDSLQTLVQRMDSLESKLARALCWFAAWDMTRDAEMKPADYIELVLRGAESETDPGALSTILSQAISALHKFTPVDQRAELREKLTKGLTVLANRATPGSDQQLLFVRRLAAVANDQATADHFMSWLADHGVPAGLQMDAELRWTLLIALARMGIADDAMVEAELQRDNSIAGHESAAAARAAMPTDAAKQEAWRRATEDVSTPNETQRSICMHFIQPDQEELLTPYITRYFDLAEAISEESGIWQTRSRQVAQVCTAVLFPPIASREVLTQVDQWLESKQLSEPVSRTVTERRDQLVRALKCQEAAQA